MPRLVMACGLRLKAESEQWIVHTAYGPGIFAGRCTLAVYSSQLPEYPIGLQHRERLRGLQQSIHLALQGQSEATLTWPGACQHIIDQFS